MKKLNYTNSLYRTAPQRISLFSRLFPELSLYGRFLTIVFRDSARAKHGKYSDEAWCSSSMACLRALEKVGVQVEVSGVHHIEQAAGPFVVIGNHMSLLETVVLPVIIRPVRKVTYIVKQSLIDYPVFGHVMRSRDPIAVSRINPRQDLMTVIQGGKERLEKGVSIIVFPQTSRMHDLDPGQFSTIGVKLAQKAGVPIIPLALKTDAWGNGRYLKDFGPVDPAKRVYLAFGEPIRVQGRGTEEHKAIIRFITEKLDTWRAA